MGVAVNLDTELVKIARSYSGAECRSVPKQIEHWAKIGRIAEENRRCESHAGRRRSRYRTLDGARRAGVRAPYRDGTLLGLPSLAGGHIRQDRTRRV